MWHSRYSDQDRGWTIRVRFPVGEIGLFLLRIDHTDFAPSAFCSLNIRVKKSERESNCYPICRVKLKDEWSFLKNVPVLENCIAVGTSRCPVCVDVYCRQYPGCSSSSGGCTLSQQVALHTHTILLMPYSLEAHPCPYTLASKNKTHHLLLTEQLFPFQSVFLCFNN